MARSRLFPVGVATVALSAIVGGVMGRNVAASQDRLTEDYRTFTAALDAVEARYVDKVESDRIVYGAISGMLQTLDPHSNFMDPQQYAQLRERQEGRYYGLGITIGVVDGDITVVSLFEGSPAYKLGIRRGDIIAKIDGEDAKGWKTDQAVRKLRGKKGTSVEVSIKRPGSEGLINIQVVRDEINIPTIPAEFMIDAQTGYVRLQDFAENTDRDLGRALAELGEKGMKRLVLDIRNNPGGPLDQAIRVANRFLKKGDLIVYTRGRVPNSDQDFRATEESDYTDLPMVVLTNRNSASASEIVSGAIKDYHAGVIMGTQTYGKGLVQTVVPLRGGSAIAITTARYLTPNGNDINRGPNRRGGIAPDIAVEATDEDWIKQHDVQLQKAVDWLHEKIGYHKAPATGSQVSRRR
jgi:carboxyl-terminal processing protease